MNSIRLGYGRYLSPSRYRIRKGLPYGPLSDNPLTDGPDWSYSDGKPGLMNKAQSLRYLRDQEFGRTIVEYNKQFKAVEEMRKAKLINSQPKDSQ